MFFPFSIETSKYSGSCNNINYPYAKICGPDIAKNLNVKVEIYNVTAWLQYTYCSISHELKTTKHWNLVS